jgi:hypothetical protein
MQDTHTTFHLLGGRIAPKRIAPKRAVPKRSAVAR